MKKKFDFSDFIARRWYVYVIWLFVSIIVATSAFSMITSAKKDERVSFFICADEETGGLAGALDERRPDGIKQINVTVAGASDPYYGLLLTTRGYSDADILILPETAFTEEDVRGAFAPLDEHLFKKEFGSATAYEADGVIYGIKVFDKKTGEGAAKGYLTYSKEGSETSDVYLFFNKKSVNLGALGKCASDGAIKLCKAFIAL